MANSTVRELLFYKGQFSKVLNLTRGRAQSRVDPFEVGALCMLGRANEAELLMKGLKGTRQEIIFCKFWISVAAIRSQKYRKAHFYMRELLSLRHQRLSREEQFYVWQLFGFYAFFKNNYSSAIHFGEKAWQKGFLAGKPFLQILALDLRGQSYFHAGETEQALQLLNRAYFLAKKIDDLGLAQTLRNTIIVFSSQNLSISTHELEKRIIGFKDEDDDYSRTLIGLELVQRFLFEGQAKKASYWLDQLKDTIYAQKNERHLNQLNHRLNSLNDLKRGGGRNNFFLKEPIAFQRKIQDLIDSEFQNVEIKKYFIDLGLLSPFLPLFKREKYCLVIDLIADATLVFDQGNISFEMGGLSQQLRGLLLLLLQGPQSSEDLIQKLYGYKYDSLRHDSMIAGLVHRLRKRIKISIPWLELKRGAYRLHPDFKIIFFEQHQVRIIEEPVQRRMKLSRQSPLNFRQTWAIEKAQREGWIRPSEIVKEFSVTPMTAFRDLKLIEKEGWLKSMGKGRASHYVPFEKEGGLNWK